MQAIKYGFLNCGCMIGIDTEVISSDCHSYFINSRAKRFGYAVELYLEYMMSLLTMPCMTQNRQYAAVYGWESSNVY